MYARHKIDQQVQRAKRTRGLANNKGLTADEQARKYQRECSPWTLKRMDCLKVADKSIAGSSSAAAAAAAAAAAVAVAVLHSSTATLMDYAPDMKQRQACL